MLSFDLEIKNASAIADLEVDLLSQLFGLVVLGTGATVGGQGQEGRAHGAATRVTAEVLGPAGDQVAHGEVILQ